MDTNEEEQTMPRATLMSKIGSKDVNTLVEISQNVTIQIYDYMRLIVVCD